MTTTHESSLRGLPVDRRVPPRDLVTVDGATTPVPAPDALVHLQFRRFAGCPVCNLHLRAFAARHDEIVGHGVREVAVFHTSGPELQPHTADLPFAVVPDPTKRLYAEFGVEPSVRGFVNPRGWPMIVRALARSVALVLRGRQRPPRLRPEGGRYGLPADFLIAPDGRVVERNIGRHLDDHWSVDDLLEIVVENSARSAVPGEADVVKRNAVRMR